MDVIEAIKKRFSCRAYQPRPVEREKLERVLEAARLAPSAKNLQDWRFVVVTEQRLRRHLAVAANNQMFVAEAPVVIAACSGSDYVMRCGQAVGPIDVSIALEHIALAATACGLATCWVGAFDAAKVCKILDIPLGVVVIELMTLGYPVDKGAGTDRKPLGEIVSYERWGF